MAENQLLIVQLRNRCFICTGFAINSKLYVHDRYDGRYTYHTIYTYDIVDSNEGLKLQHDKSYNIRTYNHKSLDNFKMRDHIFFQAHAAFPSMLGNWVCDIGYRKENNNCVDIDECKIMRHYCSNRKTF